MADFKDNISELDALLEAMCEDRLTLPQVQRLEQLVLSDPLAMRRYVEYIDLHGSLLWDVGVVASQYPSGANSAEFDSVHSDETCSIEMTAPVEPGLSSSSNVWAVSMSGSSITAGASSLSLEKRTEPTASLFRKQLINFSLAAACLVWGAVVLFVDQDGGLNDFAVETSADEGEVAEPSGDDSQPALARRNLQPVELDARGNALANETRDDANDRREETLTAKADDKSGNVNRGEFKFGPRYGSADGIVAFIDERISAGLEGTEIIPSPLAEDSEWLRRVYLDVVGHIPPAELVVNFLSDPRPAYEKRAEVIDRLLDDPAYVRNWTTIWTNLLVGRSVDPDVDREAMQKFLRDSFAHNRPWNDVVYDIVAAEGSTQENGAAAFLVAHMNNQAVPATAITARIFLGMQVQCTQCHDHPHNDWKQDQFWELKSFFKQTTVVREEVVDPQTGKSVRVAKLQVNPSNDPEYYENRRGLMKVAYPEFNGVKIDRSEATNRRQELAKLMADGDRPQLAASFVNRMWAHFFGYGFTNPVDDMGPHNTPTHPELLERLTKEFIAAGYDVKQLIRWICLSDAYHRSSQFSETNATDDPEAGLPPLFSRVYPKSMTAEQLYDSLVVATRPQNEKRMSWAADDERRHQWMQQFVTNMNTDENDEAKNFEGTISLALLMMNSEMMTKALSYDRGTYLSELLKQRMTDQERLRMLCVAALSREPTEDEMNFWRKVIFDRVTDPSIAEERQVALAQGLQDVFWAYLNSNEFVIVP